MAEATTDGELIVSRDLLPENEAERTATLHNYFGDLVAFASPHPLGWKITLTRPPRAEYYVDPRLQQGLDWWSRCVGPISVDQIPFAYAQRQGFQLSFSDAWTLVSWSEYLERHQDGLPSAVNLLHVDDHRDMMCPHLAECNGRIIDLLTGEQLVLTDPPSVRGAVRSGAVGMGSFVVPFLHYGPRVDFRHLCATRYGTDGQSVPISMLSEGDTLVSVGSRRPSVEMPANPSHFCDANAHRYLGTPDVDVWLRDLSSGPILLHLDMDYFNNRFDGDSDWIDHVQRHDPPLGDVLAQIDCLFESLAAKDVTAQIEDCCVSLSPGFFPAEFWESSITRVEHHIRHLHAIGLWHAGNKPDGT